jgi:AraC family transcriptional regulator, transcriptional activator of pobA
MLSPTCCHLPVFRIDAFGESVRSTHFDFARLENRMSMLPYPHRHDFFPVCWVTHGSGQHIIDSERYEVKPHTLFFMSPGQVHDFQLSEDTTGYTINFSSEFFSLQLENKKILHEIPVYKLETPIAAVYMDSQQAASLQSVIDDIGAEYEAEQGGYEDVLRSYLAIFLLKASRFAEPVANTEPAMRALMLARRFKGLLEENFRKLAEVEEYACMLRVTERALNEATRRALGATANKLIRDRVMLEAKRLLLHSDTPIQQIADQLAFEDPAYFSRCFKKHTGRSPLDYRQALANLHTESPRTPADRPHAA